MTSPKTCPDFTVSFMSDELAVRDALGKVKQHLNHLDLGADNIATFELVAAEVLNNIVEHAYADGPDGVVSLSCVQMPDGLHLKFEDKGQAMPDGTAPNSTLPDPDVAFYDLAEGGFGWFMIHELTKDLAYRRENQRNVLTLRFPFGPSVDDQDK
jgi:serine/threonine-protein kinase RsbW